MKTLLLYIVLSFTLIGFFESCKKEKEIWYCPMHPTYTSDRAGQCPICNMTLVKKEILPAKSTSHSEHDHENMPASTGDKKEENTIHLPEEKQRLIGIKTARVELIPLSKKIVAYSRVAYDPELYTAILEYREAKKASQILTDDSLPNSSSLANASIVRLKQLGLSDSQISEWGNSNRNPDELILGSKNGRAYIYSSIYETDIGYVKKGLKVSLKIDSFPDKIFTGTIQSIDSILDEQNRTLRFRSYVSDRDNILKPQMFGNIEISIPLKKALSIPKSALLNTGKHKLAYKRVSIEEFTPVMVKTGMETDDYYEVLEGLEEGNEIVVESNFLLDSESKIKLGGSSNEHNH
ncbi:MAG TPA: efflux RND transporter periplasmic adaptor subunit [Leptospiraceae bacterium]|nr:efflux RND transporter periplasmic adaptor subunit [Leptospiraceae bacterium]HMW05377.1 efflux RND transporter periplasmic adaptor subunit [Leptospiraceae bacterium]HMX32821.1 efflux RND transporter periplasmic adaptor subunit [Leptospiraceae bacterium]HMY33861.1 efflux RND transporter periplasmic adaptor subunit [Leptospiraceae bacterium]HMZ64479.1 efflux RND transporter periplasmic adaptor subunit [Leptospiraceae bacterium]